MRILFVNDYKDKIGGAEIYVSNVMEILRQKGHTVSLFSSDVSKEQYIKENAKVNILILLKRIFNFKSYFLFKKEIEEFKPDIIHIHNIFNEVTPSILLATATVPVVMTVHDNRLVNAVTILSQRTGNECNSKYCPGCINCVGLFGMVYERIKKFIHKLLLKKIILFTTPSNFMADFISKVGYKPVKVIPNGIKLLPYSKILNFNQLLFVGRLTKEKGVDYLLKAMPKVVEKFPSIKLVIAGDGEEKENLVMLSKKLEVDTNVKFTGNVVNEKLYELYKFSTIVVVPSVFSDNFPTVCLEALSVGRPVIARNVGGISEIIEDGKTGFLIKRANVDELSNRIVELLINRSNLNNMSENTQNISKTFSILTNVNKLYLIYENLLSNSGS